MKTRCIKLSLQTKQVAGR